jgi:hypothetical protein
MCIQYINFLSGMFLRVFVSNMDKKRFRKVHILVQGIRRGAHTSCLSFPKPQDKILGHRGVPRREVAGVERLLNKVVTVCHEGDGGEHQGLGEGTRVALLVAVGNSVEEIEPHIAPPGQTVAINVVPEVPVFTHIHIHCTCEWSSVHTSLVWCAYCYIILIQVISITTQYVLSKILPFSNHTGRVFGL